LFDKPEMPLILPPGEHRLTAHADGRRDAERNLHLASGDDNTVELALSELPSAAPAGPAPTPARPSPRPVEQRDVADVTVVHAPVERRWLSLGAGYGTNLRRAGDTGAPSLRVAVALGSRLELGVDGVFVAYAVVPSIGVRLAGDALSVHLVGAAPIAFITQPMSSMFVAGAAGLGVRLRVSPSLAFRIESYASVASKGHGTTVPTFLRGELWF
jgi:hypothetical protein